MMCPSTFQKWGVALGIALLGIGTTHAEIPEKFDPAEFLKPASCQEPYTFDASGNTCVPNVEVIKKLDQKACEALKFVFTPKSGNVPATCAVGSAKAPAPECKAILGYTAKASGEGKDAKCSYTKSVAAGAPGEYKGDCFTVRAIPPGSGLTANKTYFVSDQRVVEGEDRELTLVPGTDRFLWIGCRATGEQGQTTINASALMRGGASRYGFAHGPLTMPYKYYPSSKSFTSSVPLGWYLGMRFGQAGSGWTLAGAVTMSQVKANTVDPTKIDPATSKPTVTGTTDVPALSVAGGVMFDLLKGPSTKAFKAGLFIGKDRVSQDPTIEYRFNRKTWIAVQLGFDFTDF